MISTVVTKFFQLLFYVRPPNLLENGDRDLVEKVTSFNSRVHTWRWAVSFWTVVSVLMWIAFAAYAEGRLPFYAGYATQEEVKGMKVQIDRVEIRQLEITLLLTRQGQCGAIKKGGDSTFYTQRLNELLRDYRQITGENWRIPDCSEVVPP